jgi:hypothetical protein
LRIQYSPFRKSSTYNSYTFLNRFPQGMPLLIHGLVICHRSILPEMPEAAPTSSVCVPPPPSSGEQDDIKLAISCPPDLASEQRRLLLTTRVIPPTEAASISWGGGGNNYQEDRAVEDHLALDRMPPIYTMEKDISQRVLPIAPNQILGSGLRVHSMCLLREFLSAFYSITLYLIYYDI